MIYVKHLEQCLTINDNFLPIEKKLILIRHRYVPEVVFLKVIQLIFLSSETVMVLIVQIK